MIVYRIICYLSLVAITYFGMTNPWVFLSLAPLLVAYVFDASKFKAKAEMEKEYKEKVDELVDKVRTLENRLSMRGR